MKPALRSVEDWKAALTTLPDGPFFDLMRGYLGDIRTPFNKQRLVDELSAFLSRREVQDTLKKYLDGADRKVIAAVAQLGEPTAGELAAFFEGEYSFAELHGILLNLEERLILYRFRDRNRQLLALNPLLSALFSPFIADTSLLFPSRPAERTDDLPRSRRDDMSTAAALAFLYSRPEVFKADGTLKKKAQEEADRIFPDFDLAGILASFRNLGILRVEEGVHRLDEDRVNALAALSPEDRREYLAAGYLAAELNLEGGGRRPARDRIQGWARLVHALGSDLSPDRLYPETTVHRLSDVLERSLAEGRRRWDDGTDPAAEFRAGSDPSVFCRALVSALTGAGLLIKQQSGELLPVPAASAGSGTGTPAAAFDAPFSCILYPELPFSDAAALARFCDVLDVGSTVRFGISRESAVRGFDLGIDPEAMLSLLDRLSGGRVDQSLRWSVREWRKRYAGLSVHRGLVLVIEEERRYLAEAEPVAGLISRTLAPGVYLLSAADEAQAVAALKKAGVDIVARPPEPAHPRPSVPDGRPSPFPGLEAPGSRRPSISRFAAADLPHPEAAEAESGLSAFRAALEKKDLPKDQREELAARIDRRLILSEAQLVGAAVRYEKLEAKGLDYVGKVRVAEQALASSSLVELFWRGAKGEPNRILGTPAGLEKSGGELMLIIDPAPRGERLSIAIGKISLLRRIKRSIFGE